MLCYLIQLSFSLFGVGLGHGGRSWFLTLLKNGAVLDSWLQRCALAVGGERDRWPRRT
jgi:hypothetical protein